MSKRSSFNPSLDIQIDKDVQATYDNIKKVADNVNSITLVGSSIADVQNVNANIANINIVANNKTNIDNVVGNKTNINTVANDKTNIDTVATNISSVKTVATDMAKVNNYSDTYQGSGATDPTVRNDGSPLQAGDLFFNTTLNEMRVYSGTIWKSAGSTVNGTSKRQVFTATAGQTVFTITGGYDSGFADVYLNGTKLQNGVEVDVSNGTDVVLALGATAGDIVDVVAYGAFAVANTYTKAEVDSKDALKADKAGNNTQPFKIADAVNADEAVSKGQMEAGLLTKDKGWNYDNKTTNPSITINPASIGYTWKNIVTGEVFICTDNTLNKNKWIGQLGTAVYPSTVSTFDIFGDGSAVALWQFENNANDTGGLYTEGASTGTHSFVAGKFGQALSQDTAGYVDLGIASTVGMPYNASYSVSGWFKYNGSAVIAIFNCANANTPYGDIIQINSSNALYAEMATGYNTSNAITSPAQSFTVGNWYNVIMVVDRVALTCKLYLDGVLVATGVAPATGYSSGLNVSTISDYYQSGRYTGIVDQLRIFNRVIIQTEITTLATEV